MAMTIIFVENHIKGIIYVSTALLHAISPIQAQNQYFTVCFIAYSYSLGGN